MGKLSDLFKGFEKSMSAAAFAEEGEFDTARKIAAEPVKDAGRCVSCDEDVTEGSDLHSPAYGK